MKQRLVKWLSNVVFCRNYIGNIKLIKMRKVLSYGTAFVFIMVTNACSDGCGTKSEKSESSADSVEVIEALSTVDTIVTANELKNDEGGN